MFDALGAYHDQNLALKILDRKVYPWVPHSLKLKL